MAMTHEEMLALLRELSRIIEDLNQFRDKLYKEFNDG